MNVLFSILWFTPAYVANAAATLSKFFQSTHPIDAGKNFTDGRRILGDGKTWEGLMIGTLTGFVLGYPVLYFFGLGTMIDALLLSFGALFGDLVGSFVKRRVGLKRGEEAPLLDQLDFVFGAFLLDPPIPSWAITIIFLTPILHRLANITAYLLGVKDEPW